MNLNEIIELLQAYPDKDVDVQMSSKEALTTIFRMDKEHIHFDDVENSIFEISIANEERTELTYKVLDLIDNDREFSQKEKEQFYKLKKQVDEMPHYKYYKVFCLTDYLNKRK